jgi:hypothetical protein
MTVKQLRDQLSMLSPIHDNDKVVLQRSPDGEDFAYLYEVQFDMIFVSGECYDAVWEAEEANVDEVTWKKILAMPRCIVLVP